MAGGKNQLIFHIKLKQRLFEVIIKKEKTADWLESFLKLDLFIFKKMMIKNKRNCSLFEEISKKVN